MSRTRIPILFIALLLTCGLAAAEVTETFDFSGREVSVRNMIGKVTVSGGSAFRATVHVRGADATPGLVTFDASGDSLVIEFPLREHREYVYPPLGNGRVTTSFDRGGGGVIGSILGALSGSDRITVRGSGSGLRVWADVEITVPDDRALQVRNGIGDIVADGVRGDLLLDGSSGTVEARRIEGKLTIDTGSGDVHVENVRGTLSVDTGSGDVTGTDLDVAVLSVDTGSGEVEFDRVETGRLVVDTGSGDVRITSAGVTDAHIDTGSGGVTLALVRMGSGTFEIDTGSGGIDLIVPEDLSATIDAETGSGGIRHDLKGAIDVRRERRDELRMVVGAGGTRIRLDTGSGGITLRHAG